MVCFNDVHLNILYNEHKWTSYGKDQLFNGKVSFLYIYVCGLRKYELYYTDLRYSQ